MATAIFNTNIETPSSDYGKARTYDLDSVITKYGFGDYISFSYVLGNQYLGVSLLDNVLSVESNAYGEISVIVSTVGKQPIQATASTKLYGFYATSSEILNTTATADTLQVALVNVKKDWPSLFGIKNQAVAELNPDVAVNTAAGGKKP